MNYATLFTTIQGYVENDFPSGTFASSTGTGTTSFTAKQQIDTFIQQAEQRIYNSVQFPSLRKNMTGNTSSGNNYLSLPPDFLAVYSLAVIDGADDYHYLLNKDVNFIRESYPSASTQGRPDYYALFGPTTTNPTPPSTPTITNELSAILGPTPDADYSVELHFYYYPESITTASTTWLGDNFDSVLLYGSLIEAYTYMKGEPDVISFYIKKYDEAMLLAKRLGDGMERRDAYRSGQFRMAVT